jgi:demethylmenaquinone methyltransferase / 2-methoxy-6-polyprenyl-1,4-benzoquinol methylase
MGLAVQKMFDGIAIHYDFLNHFLSLGRDRAWRRKAVASLGTNKNLRVLDLCGGTGDFWKTWLDQGYKLAQPTLRNNWKSENIPRSVIADFSLPMLLEAKQKIKALTLDKSLQPQHKPYLVRMDALNPCFKDAHFDIVLCAYGMRNLDSVPAGVDAMHSLLRPGGTFLTLEFFRPTTGFTHFFYGILAPLCIPFLGWIFSSKREAYTYLVASIRKFSSAAEYGECFQQRGFKNISIIPCDFGISHIVRAVKG